MPISSATLAGDRFRQRLSLRASRGVGARLWLAIHVEPKGTAPCPSEDTALQSTNRINRPSQRELEQSSDENEGGEATGSLPGVRIEHGSATLTVPPSITKWLQVDPHTPGELMVLYGTSIANPQEKLQYFYDSGHDGLFQSAFERKITSGPPGDGQPPLSSTARPKGCSAGVIFHFVRRRFACTNALPTAPAR